MEPKIIFTIVILSLVIVVSLITLYRDNNQKKPVLDMNDILTLFDKSNIVKTDFVRNKLVISFTDIELLNVEKLQALGAKGINIIGDKIKFFVSDDEEVNKMLYNKLVDYIER